MWRYGVLFLIVLTSCQYKRTVQPAFYYWKTQYRQDKVENRALHNLKVRQLFVRIMDVDMEEAGSRPIPVSPITFQEAIPDSLEIIPVVYIVNKVFADEQSDRALTVLASKILTFVEAKLKQGGKKAVKTLQIDCDWTRSTRDRYFTFLKELKILTDQQQITLSVTLRLHQVKNTRSSGIPPVDKALLMCYNMGNLRKYGTQNSILDSNEMETYLKGFLGTYPLDMDVALPLFSWSVVFRNRQYIGISKRLESASLADTALFFHENGSSLYRVKTAQPKAGLQFNDVVRREEVNIQDLYNASEFLSRYLPKRDLRIVFYHLDADLLNRFSDEQLQEVIDRF